MREGGRERERDRVFLRVSRRLSEFAFFRTLVAGTHPFAWTDLSLLYIAPLYTRTTVQPSNLSHSFAISSSLSESWPTAISNGHSYKSIRMWSNCSLLKKILGIKESFRGVKYLIAVTSSLFIVECFHCYGGLRELLIMSLFNSAFYNHRMTLRALESSIYAFLLLLVHFKSFLSHHLSHNFFYNYKNFEIHLACRRLPSLHFSNFPNLTFVHPFSPRLFPITRYSW